MYVYIHKYIPMAVNRLSPLFMMTILLTAGCASNVRTGDGSPDTNRIRNSYNFILFGHKEQANDSKSWFNLIFVKFLREQSRSHDLRHKGEKRYVDRVVLDILPEKIVRGAVISLTSWLQKILIFQDEFDFLFMGHYENPTYKREQLIEQYRQIGQIDKNKTYTVLNEKKLVFMNLSFFNKGVDWKRISYRDKIEENEIYWLIFWPFTAYFSVPKNKVKVFYITPFNNIHFAPHGPYFTLLGIIGKQKNYAKLLPFYFHVNSALEYPSTISIPLLSLYVKNDFLQKTRILGLAINDNKFIRK